MQAAFEAQNVLVTGAAGFIGSHLCDQLLASGAQVYGVDNFLTGRASNIEHLQTNSAFHFIEADVTSDPASYLPAEVKFDLILHFASPASPPRYQEHPVETYLVNSQGTHNLLQYLLSTNKAGRFLYAGSSEAYGDPQVHPQTESYWGNVNPNGIRSCYDEGKRFGETICGVHYRDLGLDTRIVRIFNTYGPRMDPTDGRVIPQFVSEALAGKPLTIYGDGSQTRSYCFVSDLVAGILLMASTDGAAGETVNLGNPGEFTVKQTAEIIHQCVNPGQEIAIEFLPLPGDDPTRRRPDVTKAKSLLGWEPVVSFEDGIKDTIEFFKHAS